MLYEVSEAVIKWLRQNWVLARRQLNERYNRTLPFGDYIVNRWDKAKELGFGEGTSIYDSSLVIGDVQVGSNTWIGPFTILDGSGGLVIGDYCSISAGVQIYSHDTVKWATSEGVCEKEKVRTIIGNRCYIGPNVVISKGVVIGDGCVIGANSFVRESIPPGMKAVGSPSRVIDTAI